MYKVNKANMFGWTKAKTIFQAHRYGTDYEGLKGKDLDPDKYEWVIQGKSQQTLDEEMRIKSRLAQSGY